MTTNKKIALVSMLTVLMVSAMLTVNVANAVATLSITPNNSNIILAEGTGFNASKPVLFKLMNKTVIVYNYNKSATANSVGAFNITLITPTSISGVYNFTATSNVTSGVKASTLYTVPNLKGAQGIQGVAGVNGAQGVKGDKGDKGDTGDTGAVGTVDMTMIYFALFLGFVALLVSGYTLVRKKG